MAVKMNGMGSWNKDLVGGRCEVLGGDDKVDITFSVVLWYHCVFLIEGGIVKVQNRGIREIEPME